MLQHSPLPPAMGAPDILDPRHPGGRLGVFEEPLKRPFRLALAGVPGWRRSSGASFSMQELAGGRRVAAAFPPSFRRGRAFVLTASNPILAQALQASMGGGASPDRFCQGDGGLLARESIGRERRREIRVDNRDTGGRSQGWLCLRAWDRVVLCVLGPCS
jgi:hypothetical protein